MSAPLCGLNENGQLEKLYIADGMPIGAVFPFYGTTPPAHTLACNGAAISRTTYAELFAVIGTTAGAGDGSTTFNVPDLRGMFIRGTGGNAAELGVEQGDAIRDIKGHVTVFGSWASLTGVTCCISPEVGELQNNCFSTGNTGTNAAANLQSTGQSVTNYGLFFQAGNVVPTAAENRPVNVAMTYCIVYEN